MSIAATVVFSSLLVAAAVSDVRVRRVPNLLNAIFAGLGAGAVWMGIVPTSPRTAFIAAGCALAVGSVVQSLRLMGGGDVKLYIALAVWLGSGIVTALLVSSIAGGALAVFFLRRSRIAAIAGRDSATPESRSSPWQLDDGPDHDRVPYAVAIAIGGLWAWFGWADLF